MSIALYDSGSKYYRTIQVEGQYRTFYWISEIANYLDCFARTMVCWSSLTYPIYADEISVAMADRRPSIHEALRVMTTQEGEGYQPGGYFISGPAESKVAYNVAMIPILKDKHDAINIEWARAGLENLLKDHDRIHIGGLGIHVPVGPSDKQYRPFLKMLWDVTITHSNSVHLFGRGAYMRVLEEVAGIVQPQQLILLPERTDSAKADD